MNKFLPQTGGHHLYLDDFVFMQNSYLESLKAFGRIFSNNTLSPYVITGCARTTTGANYVYGQGYIFFNDEVFYFEGGTLPSSSYSNHYLKISEIQLSPPDPIQYADSTLRTNIHLQRTLKLKVFNSSTFSDGSADPDGINSDIENTNGIRHRNIVTPKLDPYGLIYDWIPEYAGEENVVFDSTGLGSGRMYGYAICNGKNGTKDMRGKFTLMTNAILGGSATILNPFVSTAVLNTADGASSASFVVQKENLTSFNFPINDSGHGHGIQWEQDTLGSGGSGVNVIKTQNSSNPSPWVWQPNPFTLAYGAIGNPILENTTGITVNSGGGSVPINIQTVPPYYATIKVKKLNL